MTNNNDLSTVGAGFAHEAFGSQSTFKAALVALSYPGRPVALAPDAEIPQTLYPTSSSLLLALLDQDCKLWLSPKLVNSPAATWLTFHTGCALTQDPAQAQFAWVNDMADLPPLAAFANGSDEDPEQSTTVLVDVPELRTPTALDSACAFLTLKGPGIPGTRTLGFPGLPLELLGRFASMWADNHESFPRGTDVIFTAPTLIAGLPRSTHIYLSQER